jgi:hypothetical protein
VAPPAPQTTTTATPATKPSQTKPAQPKPTAADKKPAPATKDTAALRDEMGGVWSIADVDDGRMHGSKFQLSELAAPAEAAAVPAKRRHAGGGR